MSKYSVEAILKATGADEFTRAFGKAKDSVGGMEGATKKSAGGLKSMMGGIAKVAGGIGVTKLLAAGFNAVRNSIDGAVTRVDTLNQFPKVLQQMGYSADEATGATDRLSDGIQGLPTRLDEVVATTQRFVTAFGDVDLATESALALNNALLASGASTEQTANATDQYVKTMSSGKLEMDTWNTLSETMSYGLSEVAKDLGIADGNVWTLYDSIQDGNITLEEFNQAMIDASTETGGFAETALTASEGLRTSWSNVQTAIATGVANVIQAINDWMADNGLGGISKQFDNLKVAVQEAFKYVVDNVPVVLGAITNLFNTVKESTAFQSLKEVVTEAIDYIKELFTAVSESTAFQEFKDIAGEVAQALLDIDFREVIDQITEFLETWGPLIAGIAAGIAVFKGLTFVAGIFSAISAAGGILAIVMGTLSVAGGILGGVIAFLTSPIFLAAAAIAALVAAGVWLYQNWDTIKEKASELGTRISEIWTSVKEWTSEAWDNIWTKISETVTNVWTTITEWFGGLPEWFSTTWASIVETVTTWASEMIAKAIEVGTGFLENIVTFFSELPYNIGFFLGTVIGTVIQWGIDMWAKAKETGSNFVTGLIEWFSQLPGRIGTWITNTYNKVTTWASNMWAKAKETGSNFINGIITWFQQLPGRIQTWLSNAISRVTTWASNMATKAREAGSKFINNVITFIQQLPGKLQTWLTNTINKVITWGSNLKTKGREAATKLMNGIIDKAKEIPGKIQAVGKNVVEGLWKGIQGAKDWVMGKVEGFFGGIVDGVMGVFGVKSPSRVFMYIGDMLDRGLGKGIEKGEKHATNPLENMLDNAMGIAKNASLDIPAFQWQGNDLNAQLAVANPQINGRVEHEMTNNLNTQPAYINLNIGGTNYRAFVENISNEQGRMTDLDMQF